MESEVFAFDRTGLIHRFDSSVSDLVETGQFQFGSRVQTCLADAISRRLYVLTGGLVMWVFDLTQPGLSMPRAVTTDQAQDALHGLGLYGTEYVVTQSLGDHAFLVFGATDMALVARFRIEADVPARLDGVTVSGGFAVTIQPLKNMPKGALVAHDRYNRLPDEGPNLKVVDWRLIEKTIKRGN